MEYRSGLLFLFGLGCMELLAAVLGLAPDAAGKFKLPTSVACSLEPVGQPAAGQPLVLELRAIPRDSCDELRIMIERREDISYTGDTVFTVPATVGQMSTHRFPISLPDSGIAGMSVAVHCGRAPTFVAAYFDIRPDTICLYAGRPGLSEEYWAPHWKNQPEAPVPHADPIEDTLTEEHLNTVYEVYLVIADSTERNRVEDVLGYTIPDSAMQNDGSFRLALTLRELIALAKLPNRRFNFEYVTPPPWVVPAQSGSTPPADRN